MRQAIEEGFILDLLQNYTPYSLAFKLAAEGQEISNQEVDRGTAMKGLMSWVRLHPHNISQKVKIVVEHFRANVADLLDGQAKAMVVLQSRKEAVRWKLAIDKYIAEQGYGIGTLVAFSGEVSDAESGPDPFSETGKTMNPDLKGRDIREAFNEDDRHILLVANKFQTGFDQPLLCAMYVDRRLAGVQAVQTLSRLNRAYRKDGVVKDTTYVLDFSDSADEVLKAFSQYYGEAELEDVTDPNIIFDLRAKLDEAGHYDDFEVDRVVSVAVDPKSKQGDLVKAVEPVAQRLVSKYTKGKKAWAEARSSGDEAAEKQAREQMDALDLFKRDLQTYLRVYAFLSQIFDYGSTEIEKRAIFYRYLVKLLEFGREREGVDLSKVVLTHHKISSKGRLKLSPDGEDAKLSPVTEPGSGKAQDPEKLRLAEIIEKLNDLFEGEITDQDKLTYVNDVLRKKLMESEILVRQAKGNTKDQFSHSPHLAEELENAIIESFSSHTKMSSQALDSERVRAGLREILLGPGKLWETLRDAT
jgi:type I restriction enzyme R subunit